MIPEHKGKLTLIASTQIELIHSESKKERKSAAFNFNLILKFKIHNYCNLLNPSRMMIDHIKVSLITRCHSKFCNKQLINPDTQLCN